MAKYSFHPLSKQSILVPKNVVVGESLSKIPKSSIKRLVWYTSLFCEESFSLT